MQSFYLFKLAWQRLKSLFSNKSIVEIEDLVSQ